MGDVEAFGEEGLDLGGEDTGLPGPGTGTELDVAPDVLAGVAVSGWVAITSRTTSSRKSVAMGTERANRPSPKLLAEYLLDRGLGPFVVAARMRAKSSAPG